MIVTDVHEKYLSLLIFPNPGQPWYNSRLTAPPVLLNHHGHERRVR